ncbi:hypothetical protein Plhal304r1_c030g0097231 [Plasmopara halstedii]
MPQNQVASISKMLISSGKHGRYIESNNFLWKSEKRMWTLINMVMFHRPNVSNVRHFKLNLMAVFLNVHYKACLASSVIHFFSSICTFQSVTSDKPNDTHDAPDRTKAKNRFASYIVSSKYCWYSGI